LSVISPDKIDITKAEIDPFPQHECGLFGVFGHPNAAVLTYYGLFALQHRGQESAGIVTSNGPGTTFLQHKDMGLVSQVFGHDELARLKGTRAIGHTRYSTTGTSTIKNAQPFVVDCVRGQMAIAHNGNLINADLLREELEKRLHFPNHRRQRNHFTSSSATLEERWKCSRGVASDSGGVLAHHHE
jgi:glutamine phosphoribosylpyrophosphate amidotransferase